MHWTTLVEAKELGASLGQTDLAIIDCRFDLRDPGSGARAFAAGHIPTAVYAHLDEDLSDLSRSGHGRHPLPSHDAFCARLGAMGVSPTQQVVCYDAGDAGLAARLWWMLKLLGHERVAVLDGGTAAWVAAGLPLQSKATTPKPALYRGRFNVRMIASTAVIAARMATANGVLIDARSPERFRGEIEPYDAVAGHIPGAINRPHTDNLVNGCFKPAAQLAAEFTALLGRHAPDNAFLMCGSGVTACQNLLAMEYAGLQGARVYPGSWSEWIGDPARPVARGA